LQKRYFEALLFDGFQTNSTLDKNYKIHIYLLPFIAYTSRAEVFQK